MRKNEENQQSPDLDYRPDSACVRVVPQNHEVNPLSFSESDTRFVIRNSASRMFTNVGVQAFLKYRPTDRIKK